MSVCSQRAGLRRSPCLRLPSMGHASARERLVTPLCPGPASPSAPACYLAVRTPFYPMVGHHDRKVGVAGMGGQTLQRIRFLTWLLWWSFLLVFVGVIGGAIVYLAFQDGQVVLGSGTALVTSALFVSTALARYRDYVRGRAVVAAWKWWQDSDVQRRQWRLLYQQFAPPYAEALSALEQATQRTPFDADAWADLSEALNRVGRSEEALAASERALALDPQHASAWVRMAGALTMLRRSEEALAASERALALDPEAATAWASKGTALGQLGRDAEGFDATNRAVALGIERATPWYPVTVGLNKSRLLCQLGRYAEALEACDEVLAAQPDLALGWYSKAICLHHCGRTVEAAVAVLRAKELAG